jgi:hypothetical protein
MGEVGVVRTVIVLVGFGIGFAIADIWDDNGGDSGNVVDAPTFVTSPPEEGVIVLVSLCVLEDGVALTCINTHK